MGGLGRSFQHLLARVVLCTDHHWGELSPSIVDGPILEIYLKLCDENVWTLRNLSLMGRMSYARSGQPEADYAARGLHEWT
jgi:hypothetical protein